MSRVEINQDAAKLAAARHALRYVEPGMTLGIGTGSTADMFTRLLGEAVANGLPIVGVPTSERTARLARSLSIPLSDLDADPTLDLTIDGADEFDPVLRLIKGGGGALLREKITACASRRMIVIADASKAVQSLGHFPLPVEVNRFGLGSTRLAVTAAARACGCEGEIALREVTGRGEPFVTDGGHLILDCRFGSIGRPDDLAAALNAIPGVVEHGLFIGVAEAVICAGADGVRVLGHPEEQHSSVSDDPR